MSANETQTPHPVEVNIKNWTDNPAKPPVVRNTNPRNYILTTDASFDGQSISIAGYEPARARMLIIPIDAAISIVDHDPNTQPGTSTVTAKPEGAVLPASTVGYEFFGPDAFWLLNLGTNTRVTVIKEYYAV